jgi:hypothetical protein
VIRRVILALGNGLRDAPSTGGKPLEARQECNNAGLTDYLLRNELTDRRVDFQLVQIVLCPVIVGHQFNRCPPRMSVTWILYKTVRRCTITRQEWDVMRRATLLVTRSRSISIPNFRRISHQDQKIGILS